MGPRRLLRPIAAGGIQRQSTFALASILAITGVGFISTMVFAHLLGPEIMGGYFLFLAYLGVIELVGDGGLGGAAVKRISEGKEQERYFSAFVFLRTLLFAVVALLLLLAGEIFVDLGSEGLVMPLIFALLASLLFSIGYNGTYGTGQVEVAKTGETLGYVVRVATQILAVILGFGLMGLVGGVIAGFISGALLYSRYLGLRFEGFGQRHLRSLASFSFWIFLASSGGIIFSYTDVIAIGYFLGNADVGIYRTTFQLTAAATFTGIAVQTALFPRFSSWGIRGERGAIERALSRALSYALFLAVPVCLGGMVLGDRLLYYLYGAAFVGGATVLPLLLLSQVVGACLMLISMSLSALNRPDLVFRATATGAILNLVLNVCLIPVLGILGAAAATFISVSLNALLTIRFLRRFVEVRFDLPTIGHIFAASGTMGFLVLVLRLLVPFSHALITMGTVCLGAGAYLLLLFRWNRGLKEELLELLGQIGFPRPPLLDRL